VAQSNVRDGLSLFPQDRGGAQDAWTERIFRGVTQKYVSDWHSLLPPDSSGAQELGLRGSSGE